MLIAFSTAEPAKGAETAHSVIIGHSVSFVVCMVSHFLQAVRLPKTACWIFSLTGVPSASALVAIVSGRYSRESLWLASRRYRMNPSTSLRRAAAGGIASAYRFPRRCGRRDSQKA